MPAGVNPKSPLVVLPSPRNRRWATIQILFACATRCYNAEPWPIGDRSKRVSAKRKRAPTRRHNSQNSTSARAMPWWHLNWRSGTRRPESMPKPRVGTRPRRNDSAGRSGRPRRKRLWRACALARRPWNQPSRAKSMAFPKRRLQSPRRRVRLNLLVPHSGLVPHSRLVPPSRRGSLAHPNRTNALARRRPEERRPKTRLVSLKR